MEIGCGASETMVRVLYDWTELWAFGIGGESGGWRRGIKDLCCCFSSVSCNARSSLFCFQRNTFPWYGVSKNPKDDGFMSSSLLLVFQKRKSYRNVLCLSSSFSHSRHRNRKHSSTGSCPSSSPQKRQDVGVMGVFGTASKRTYRDVEPCTTT
jgi:hypothetical protein